MNEDKWSAGSIPGVINKTLKVFVSFRVGVQVPWLLMCNSFVATYFLRLINSDNYFTINVYFVFIFTTLYEVTLDLILVN